MISGCCNMGGVGPRLGRQRNARNQGGRKICDFLRDVDQGHSLENLESTGGGGRIPGRRFIEHHLRDEKLEFMATVPPPGMGYLLVSRRNQVAARPRGQIADDACFEVNLGAHDFMLPRRSSWRHPMALRTLQP